MFDKTCVSAAVVETSAKSPRSFDELGAQIRIVISVDDAHLRLCDYSSQLVAALARSMDLNKCNAVVAGDGITLAMHPHRNDSSAFRECSHVPKLTMFGYDDDFAATATNVPVACGDVNLSWLRQYDALDARVLRRRQRPCSRQQLVLSTTAQSCSNACRAHGLVCRSIVVDERPSFDDEFDVLAASSLCKTIAFASLDEQRGANSSLPVVDTASRQCYMQRFNRYRTSSCDAHRSDALLRVCSCCSPLDTRVRASVDCAPGRWASTINDVCQSCPRLHDTSRYYGAFGATMPLECALFSYTVDT